MPLAESIRVSAIGRYTSGPWVGEEAQIGFTLCQPTGGDFSSGINDGLAQWEVEGGGGADIVPGVGRYDYGAQSVSTGPFTIANQKLIGPAVIAYLTAIRVYQLTAFSWQEVKMAAIQADGKVVNGATVLSMNPTVVGSDATADFPPTTAIVQSLTTGGRGPRNRGRWYVPAQNVSAAPQAIVSSTTMTNMNNAAKALKDAIEGAMPLKLAVYSRTHHTASRITTFRVGNHLDVQRRRAQAVPETYAELSA